MMGSAKKLTSPRSLQLLWLLQFTFSFMLYELQDFGNVCIKEHEIESTNDLMVKGKPEEMYIVFCEHFERHYYYEIQKDFIVFLSSLQPIDLPTCNH